MLALPHFVALVSVCALMVVLWLWQRRSGNAGVVDVAWAGSIGVMGVAFALIGDGWEPRRILVGAIIGLWSARLTQHLWVRVVGEPEDGRYGWMRERFGGGFDGWMFWFFQAQAVLAWLLTLPIVVVADAALEGWRVWDAVAVLLFAASVVGETVADRQLAAWKKDPDNAGATCRSGLWRYSRHPNYFFEWLHWCVYPLLALALPWGWLVWAAPLVMLFLVLKVTGIPPTEAQSVRSRGDDYRAYQRETNAFFPGPVRGAATAESPSN